MLHIHMYICKYVLYNFTYITFLKWEKYKKGLHRKIENVLMTVQLQSGWVCMEGRELSLWKGNTRDPSGNRILTILISISWLWLCTRVLQYVTTGRNWVEYTESLCSISYNCMWINNYLKKIKKYSFTYCLETVSMLHLRNF